MSITYEQAAEYFKRNPDAGRRRLAAAFSISETKAPRLKQLFSGPKPPSKDAVARLLSDKRFKNGAPANNNQHAPPIPQCGNAPTTLRRAIGASVLREQFDIPAKVRKALKTLKGEHVIADNDLRSELGIPVQTWRVVSEMSEFSDNKLAIRNKIWWGSKAALDSIRAKIDII